jgi:transposase-like protein
MEEKRRIARTLLTRGLTVTQIAGQLRCSATFVRRVRREMEENATDRAVRRSDALDTSQAGAA